MPSSTGPPMPDPSLLNEKSQFAEIAPKSRIEYTYNVSQVADHV